MFAVERRRTSDGELPPFTRAQSTRSGARPASSPTSTRVVTDLDSRLDGRRMSGHVRHGQLLPGARRQRRDRTRADPADDEPSAGQPVMVLSDRGWDRLFARDPAMLGRNVRVNGVTFEIVGVMPEGFRGLTVAPDDYWAPLTTLGQVARSLRPRDEHAGLDIIGRLKPGLSQETARRDSPSGRHASRPAPSRIERARARASRGAEARHCPAAPWKRCPSPRRCSLLPASSCSLAARTSPTFSSPGRGHSARSHPALLGVTRRRIVRQPLTESLLLALVAAAVGFAISRVALEVYREPGVDQLAAQIGDIRLRLPGADWRVAAVLIVGAGVSTMVFGLAPGCRPRASNRSG